MHPVDALVAIVLALFAVRGFGRGLVRELLSLATYVVAGGLGLRFGHKLGLHVGGAIPGPAIVDDVAGFLILFGLTVLTGRLVISLVGVVLAATGLSVLNRLAGAVFSVFKGGILIGCIVLALRAIPESGPLGGRAGSPLGSVNEAIERGYLAMRLADLTEGLFSAVMERAEDRMDELRGERQGS